MNANVLPFTLPDTDQPSSSNPQFSLNPVAAYIYIQNFKGEIPEARQDLRTRVNRVLSVEKGVDINNMILEVAKQMHDIFVQNETSKTPPTETL